MRDAVKVAALLALVFFAYPMAIFVIPVWLAVSVACDLYEHIRPPRR